ncbi:MAG: hypothetical protein QOH03_3394, partial [Kribbellaceae bacterium]|nr:hypothetical protein [Kribbellaceae bacterium]
MTPAGNQDADGKTQVTEIEQATREAKAAAAEAEAAADDAEQSADQSEKSAEHSEDAAEHAEVAAKHSEQAAAEAKAASEDEQSLVGELLIEERHPSEGMGAPGPPLRRSNPFVFGFFAVLGGLVAYGLWHALGQAKSVLILLVVSMFIAVGLNPLVEWFMRRGLKRGLAVGVVFLLMILAVTGVGF